MTHKTDVRLRQEMEGTACEITLVKDTTGNEREPRTPLGFATQPHKNRKNEWLVEMRIPREVASLLWEYDLEAVVSRQELPDAVIERIMERGTLAAMQWLRRNVSTERLRTYLERRGSRVLPPRELRFWAWLTGVPEATANRWVLQARKRETRLLN